MSGSKLFDSPLVPPLRRIVEDVLSGGIRIPEFQREFVWTDDQRIDLLDSVLRGIPIGSLLVWRTTNGDIESSRRLGPRSVRWSLPDARSATTTHLLDGLQRMTTLIGALAPRDAEITDADDDDYSIYYDLEPDAQTPVRDRLVVARQRRRSKSQALMPLHVTLDDFDLSEFQQWIRATKLPQERTASLIRESQRVASLIKDYPVPIIPIVSDDLDIVTESFQRVNSLGQPMGEADMAAALTFASGIKLLTEIAAIQQSLEELGWASIDEKIVLLSLKVSLGVEPTKPRARELRDRLLNNMEGEVESFDQLKTRLHQVTKFLRSACLIRGPGALPYAYQVVSLCDRRLNVDLSEGVHREVFSRWFWATTMSEFFASLNNTQIGRALAMVVRLAELDVDAATALIRDTVATEPVRRVTRFNFNAARTRALSVVLADNADCVTPEREQRGDRLSLLGSLGSSAIQVLTTKLPQSEPANRVVIEHEHLGDLRRLLNNGAGDALDRAMKEHIVSARAVEAWRLGDFAAFARLRGEDLWTAEKQFAESRAPSILRFDDAIDDRSAPSLHDDESSR